MCLAVAGVCLWPEERRHQHQPDMRVEKHTGRLSGKHTVVMGNTLDGGRGNVHGERQTNTKGGKHLFSVKNV